MFSRFQNITSRLSPSSAWSSLLPEDAAVRMADTAPERTAINISMHILVIGILFCFMFCRSNIATQNRKNVLKQKNVAKCLNN